MSNELEGTLDPRVAVSWLPGMRHCQLFVLLVISGLIITVLLYIGLVCGALLQCYSGALMYY